MELTIEPMTTGDLGKVLEIENDSFIRPWSLNSFKSELKSSQMATYLVARSEGCVVGYCGMWVVPDEAHITTLAVDKKFRGFGIGSRLLEAILEKAKHNRVRRISLEVRSSNENARRLYEKFGFIVKGVRKHYYFDEDGLVMFKEKMEESESNFNEPAL